MDFNNILIFSAFLVNFFLSILIHLRTTKNKANITFEIAAFGITAWCLVMIFYRMADSNTAIYWVKLLYFFPTFIPTAFFLFGLYFPNYEIKKSVLFWVVFLNVTISAMVLANGLIIKSVLVTPGFEKQIEFGPLYYFFYILYISGFFGASYFVLFRKYLSANPYIRMQILYILLGLTAASIPAMITNLTLPSFGYFELNWVGQLFTIFWVGGVSYAIVKHRLIDIKFVVARTIAYAFLVIILGAIYSILLFFIAGVFLEGAVNRTQQIVSAALALFIAFSSQPLRRLLEKITDRIFFRGFYDSQKLLASLSTIMATTLDMDFLVKETLNLILSQVKISSGTFILYGSGNKKESIEQRGSIMVQGIDKNILDFIYNQTEKVVVREELPEGEFKVLLRKLNIAVVLKLFTKNREIGILALSDKNSGDIYSVQDVNLFEILAPELSVAIHNSEEYEQIKRFNITLKMEVDRATLELRQANNKLQELDKLKDEFVSLASHELRTPMTVIKSYIWILLQGKIGPINEKQKTYLDRTFSSTNRLIDMVNDMLNISRIESGRLVIEAKPMDMEALIKDVVIEMEPRATELGIKLLHTPPSNPLPFVKADFSRIKQVLINLVGNSLKFTPQNGSISIILSVKDGFLLTQVKDTGKGISKDDFEKLFKKFNMLGGNSMVKQSGQGTGLGLYLSKALVELHGGKIWVESEGEGKGSTFSFTLPIVKAN